MPGHFEPGAKVSQRQELSLCILSFTPTSPSHCQSQHQLSEALGQPAASCVPRAQTGGPDVSILNCVPADSRAFTGGHPPCDSLTLVLPGLAPSNLPLAHELLAFPECAAPLRDKEHPPCSHSPGREVRRRKPVILGHTSCLIPPCEHPHGKAGFHSTRSRGP